MEYLSILNKIQLFQGISENELENMLKCLDANIKQFDKEDIIIMTGSEINSVGIVLSGNVKIIEENIFGNQSIIAEIGEGHIFAETFACAGIEKSPVTVIASSACKIMFISFQRIIKSCSSACTFHTRLIRNMLHMIASKNLMLKDKIELLSQRTTRDKLLNYLNSMVKRQKTTKIVIPFNRNELADFLSVDRSAMSRELCKLRDEGVIEFNKNEFEILDVDYF